MSFLALPGDLPLGVSEEQSMANLHVRSRPEGVPAVVPGCRRWLPCHGRYALILYISVGSFA